MESQRRCSGSDRICCYHRRGGWRIFFWQARKTEPVEAGSTAPDFTLPLLSGGEASLSDYRGQVVMLNIWATTCTSCREEFPSMERRCQNMKAKGLPFEMLALS